MHGCTQRGRCVSTRSIQAHRQLLQRTHWPKSRDATCTCNHNTAPPTAEPCRHSPVMFENAPNSHDSLVHRRRVGTVEQRPVSGTYEESLQLASKGGGVAHFPPQLAEMDDLGGHRVPCADTVQNTVPASPTTLSGANKQNSSSTRQRTQLPQILGP